MLSNIFSIYLLIAISTGSPISPEAANAGASIQRTAHLVGKPISEGVTTFDGVALSKIQAAPAREQVVASANSRAGWTCTVDSAQQGNPCTNVLDGDSMTYWHTQYNPVLKQLPHQITIDMKTASTIGSFSYTPRQDGSSNGNIGQHVISVSVDGTTFKPIVYGTWVDDNKQKVSNFAPVNARYVRLQALTEAGNRGPWTSAAEINVFQATAYAGSAGSVGAWGATIDFPLVAVTMAMDPLSGNVLAWSSYNPYTFSGNSVGQQTITATYNPNTNTVVSTQVTNTGHDMFCVGVSLDFNGRSIATGGNTAAATSIYDPGAKTWSKAPQMNIARGYSAQVTLSNGKIFTIGASWSGGQGGKNGEIFDPASNTWSLLPGASVTPMLTNDAQGVYRADNHGWLFAWKSGTVFQAGPSSAMNWYNTANSGSVSSAGTRGSDPDSMCGNAVMIDAVAGTILTVGGSPSYQGSTATSNAHLITIKDASTKPTVKTLPNMKYQRAFGNSIVLPDGNVFIVGGEVDAEPFSDNTAQLTPELFVASTGTFKTLAPMAVARTYHSVAMLLPDATVIVGGGGLCGNCATNHLDAQIYRPSYLYSSSGAAAPRPTISSVSSSTVKVGASFTVTLNTSASSFSLIRMGSTTHTVNTDQRRIPLKPTSTNGKTYTLAIPNDAGIAIPGYWMLFALNTAGVPSTAQTIKITPS